jgi:Phosphorylase superfamily
MPPEATLPAADRLRLGAVSVVAAMGVEAWAVRRRAPTLPVHQAGIGLRGWTGSITTPVVASVGLAGGLRRDLPPGTVVIASEVALEDAPPASCDERWVAATVAAARRLGFASVTGRVVTATHLVTGAERELWANRGFVAVDMESAHLAGRAQRLAVVRVLLDTPQHELSPAWERPSRAALDPRNFRELIWLIRNVPRYSLRAAGVLGEAVRGDVDPQV